MANWASTSYAVEGPKEVLQKIEYALNNPILHEKEGDSEGWEGGVLRTLGITWEDRKPDGSGDYLRGFIRPDVEPWYDTTTGALRFEAEEAWGITDFKEVLERNFPDIKVYYSVEECGEEIYATNDKEGKYFKDRYFVDTCIDSNYDSDYFMFESSVYKYLHNLTDGRVSSEKDVEEFNSKYEDLCDSENWIHIHKFNVID